MIIGWCLLFYGARLKDKGGRHANAVMLRAYAVGNQLGRVLLVVAIWLFARR
jgi:hypothetical protein